MYLLYSLLTLVLFVLASPYFLYQALRHNKYVDSIGQPDRARACWHEALAIYEQLGAPEAEETRLLLMPVAAA